MSEEVKMHNDFFGDGMESLRELYKIGVGPSSSHTMGPQRAAEQFKNKYPEAASFKAHLYGSLAATGEGHLTDYIIKKTLEPKHVEIIWREDIVKPYHPNGMMLEGCKRKCYRRLDYLLSRWRNNS